MNERVPGEEERGSLDDDAHVIETVIMRIAAGVNRPLWGRCG